MKAIFDGIESNDEEVQTNLLHCLAETPKLGNSNLQGYIQKIGDLTVKFLHAQLHAQLKSIFKFWENLCAEECRLNVPKEQSVICKFLDPLQDIIYQAMCLNEFENDEVVVGDSFDDEKYTVLEASSNTLL